MHVISLYAIDFILDFIVNVYWQCCAVQPTVTPLPWQADMKHRVHIAQSSARPQIQFISHLTNSLFHDKWSYVFVFELTQTCEVQIASAQ